MSVKLEKVVEKFYEGLEDGKFLGRKCKECGAVEFPPVYACNTCGCMDMEWVEISGKAVMKSIVMPAALSSKPEYSQMGPIAYGEVEIEEGASHNNRLTLFFEQEKKKRTVGETSGSGTRRDLPERRIQNRCVRAGRGIKEAPGLTGI